MTTTSDLGRVRPIHRGAWSAAAPYEPLDIVTYNNRSYFCVQAATAVLPTNTTYWAIVAEPTGVTISVGKGLMIDGVEAGSADLSNNRLFKLSVLPETKASKRNRHLNPAFQVCQDRATGASTVISSGSAYAFDGAYVFASGGGALTCQQALKTSPGGSPCRLRCTATTADAAIAASDNYAAVFPIEGVNIADLLFGTANAKSFVWRGVVNLPAGTYGLSFYNQSATRSYVTMFTIATGGVDTLVTAVVPGDTSGTWVLDTSGAGVIARICFAAGTTWQTATPGAWNAGNFITTSAQTNSMSAINNVFEVCDIGLYKGVELPDWELGSYADDLMACRRYYASMVFSIRANCTSAYNVHSGNGYFPVTMRTNPSISITPGTRSNIGSLVYTTQTEDSFLAEMVSAAGGDTLAINERIFGNARV
ncbi:hypothetical protein [Pleomorphomonas sp. PLEO]|uniref:hypothetical protein n=1 Tax=Pleomorphomonas sp. PLEO TaxID=3239306 RepID=UPI00351E9214